MQPRLQSTSTLRLLVERDKLCEAAVFEQRGEQEARHRVQQAVLHLTAVPVYTNTHTHDTATSTCM